MMTKDGLIFEANSLKQGRLQALTRQQLQAQATQNRERRWEAPLDKTIFRSFRPDSFRDSRPKPCRQWPWSKPAGNNSGNDRAHCSMKLRTRSASCQTSSYCCWVIGMTICLAPRGTCVEGVSRSRSNCRVFGRASILASPSLERSRMTKMPPAVYPAFLQYLQSSRVRKPERDLPRRSSQGSARFGTTGSEGPAGGFSVGESTQGFLWTRAQRRGFRL